MSPYESSPGRSSRHKSHSNRQVYVWLWEILAVVASLVLTGLMVALLAIYDNRPVFLFHGVTLNAIIAFLSTLSKTTLLFALAAAIGQWKWITFSDKSTRLFDAFIIDEASRGPLGSLRLLWRFKGVRGVVNLGAICTLLALAIDPFTQQLIQFRNFVDYQPDLSAAIPRAQRFSKGTLNKAAATFPTEEDVSQLLYNETDTRFTFPAADASVQSAILYGLTQPDKLVTQQLPVRCETGNCTFEPLRSLAVCSKCFDVSDAVVVTSGPTNLGIEAYSLGRGNIPATIDPNGSIFSLPIGLNISNSNGDDPINPRINMVSRGTVASGATMKFQDVDTLIWAMAILRVPPAIAVESYNWPDVTVEAMECGLFYCVNQYQPIIQNNILIETAITDVNAKRLSSSWQVNGKVGNVPDTTSIEYQDILTLDDRTDLSFDGGFNISQTAVASISWYLQRLFAMQAADYDYSSINGFFMNQPDQVSEQFRPDSIKVLMKSLDLVQTFQNIAQSLTNAIRAGSDGSTVQTGKLGRAQIRYVIKWQWISLHAFVMIMGLLYLVLTMIATANAQVPAWKSHLLPNLVWGNQTNQALNGLTTTDEMEKKAWAEKARFSFGNRHDFHAVPAQYDNSYAMSNMQYMDSFHTPTQQYSPYVTGSVPYTDSNKPLIHTGVTQYP